MKLFSKISIVINCFTTIIFVLLTSAQTYEITCNNGNIFTGKSLEITNVLETGIETVTIDNKTFEIGK